MKFKLLTLITVSAMLLSGCGNKTNYTPSSDVAVLMVYDCYKNGVPVSDIPVYTSSDNYVISLITSSSGVEREIEEAKAEYRIIFRDGNHYGDYTMYDNGIISGTQDLTTSYMFYLSDKEYQNLTALFGKE